MLVINPYYCALMFERVLPETVKPFKLARQNARLVGVVPLSAFGNFASGAVLPTAEHVVRVELGFENGPGGVALMTGELAATIPFQCQRCLDPVVLDISADVRLAIFEQEIDEAVLPEGFEPMQAEDEQVRLVDLIEQELILAAPIVPVHETCDAVEMPVQEIEIEEPSEAEPQKESPFAGLSDLLAKSEQDRKK